MMCLGQQRRLSLVAHRLVHSGGCLSLWLLAWPSAKWVAVSLMIFGDVYPKGA